MQRRSTVKRSKLKRSRPKKPKKPPVFLKINKKILGTKRLVEASNSSKKKELEAFPDSSENRIILMVRDPWWLFAYWELKDCPEGVYKVLRVYDVTGLSLPSSRSHFDIGVGDSGSWHIDTEIPHREWQTEIGFKNSRGIFFPLSRSNRVKTPRNGVSDLVDEEWSLPDKDFWKIAGLSAAGQESSLTLFEKSSHKV